jgi:hypothetical protein
MTVVHYYYRKPDGTLGKLLDDSPEAIEDINTELWRIKETFITNHVLAVIQGGKE